MSLTCFYKVYDSGAASKLLPGSVSFCLSHSISSLLNVVVSRSRIFFGWKGHSELSGRLCQISFVVEIEFEFRFAKVERCWTWSKLVAGIRHIFFHSGIVLVIFSTKDGCSLLSTLDSMISFGFSIMEISSISQRPFGCSYCLYITWINRQNIIIRSRRHLLFLLIKPLAFFSSGSYSC